jgi:copper resistance protein B
MRAAALAILLLGSAVPALGQGHHGGGPASEAAPFGAPIDDQHVWFHALANQLEGRFGRENAFQWDAEAWAGTDTNRLWLKSEGLLQDGQVAKGRHEILYDRPLSRFFNAQIGFRADADARPGRGWAAFGIEGLAPLFFHVSATGYASSRGHLAARLEGSYDLLLTQKLILQPQMELNFHAKPDPARRLGAGLTELDTGLRLRYEITRKIAPYIGVTYEQAFGGTAAYARLAGEKTSQLQFALGLRLWY